MAHRIKRPIFFKSHQDSYAKGWGSVTDESRRWEDVYRDRWAHDKKVRTTHCCDCSGSCSWEVYVKDGIVTWEHQATDFPETPPGAPNHEPRGCPRGSGYSWYLYSSARLRYPLIRAELLAAWEHARKRMQPLEAWQAIVSDPETRASWVRVRGRGGFVRASWDTVCEIIAAANLYTADVYGPDRIIGFGVVPAPAMVSYGSGNRYLSLMGATICSFLDWNCDLPPASPQTWGEAYDAPTSLNWYYSSYLLVIGANLCMSRTPDAHFLTEARYNGTKVVNVCPDYCETTKDADWWLPIQQGTDPALGMAMAHVIFNEFHANATPDPYFTDYIRRLTDMPILVRLDPGAQGFIPGRTLRASDLPGGEAIENAEWKTVVEDKNSNHLAIPAGSIGVAGGGWNFYVGQEKVRPEAGFSDFSFALDWEPQVRHMNSPDFWYVQTDQWRYEQIPLSDMLSPLADARHNHGTSIDFFLRSIKMGWLPFKPELNVNPLTIADAAARKVSEIAATHPERFANRADVVDNDWVEVWNANGALSARAIVSSRLHQGMCIVMHATEKTINTPGSEITGKRGGGHNAPTRLVLNPTHMIGGYAQLSYTFNYYGDIAPNRDDFVWLRKMNRIDWMEETEALGVAGEERRAS